MASSITNPTAAARPPKVIRLKLCPVSLSTINVISSVTGMTNAATNEEPQSRKKITRIPEDRMMPIRTASRTLAMESLTIVD